MKLTAIKIVTETQSLSLKSTVIKASSLIFKTDLVLSKNLHCEEPLLKRDFEVMKNHQRGVLNPIN